MIEVLTIETPALGDRSYLVTDGEVAAVIDPQRDIDRVLEAAAARGVRITHVAETHIHNDYVTGGLELARRVGAAYLVAAAEDVAFERTPVAPGDTVAVGAMTLRALATPGHTPHHLAYALDTPQGVVAVFSGGSLLYGTVGRTDLIAPEATLSLTRDQYRSARHLVEALPGTAEVYPTHGFGSFCSSLAASDATTGAPAEPAVSTLARERQVNLVWQIDDEDRFVKELIAGLDAYPRYYAHMGPTNRAGPAPLDLSPPEPAEPAELRRRIDAGEWVVDLRTRRAFAAAHVAGTVNVELGDPFATYVGWVMPWGTPITLVGDDPEEVAGAQRALARVGIDRPAGAATGGIGHYGEGSEIRRYRVARFADLNGRLGEAGVVVLDVRRGDEWRAGHLPGAVHIPIHDLPERLGEVPDGEELWVHCGSGYRAALAASILDGAGRPGVVLVDDDWDHAAPAGLPVTTT